MGRDLCVVDLGERRLLVEHHGHEIERVLGDGGEGQLDVHGTSGGEERRSARGLYDAGGTSSARVRWPVQVDCARSRRPRRTRTQSASASSSTASTTAPAKSMTVENRMLRSSSSAPNSIRPPSSAVGRLLAPAQDVPALEPFGGPAVAVDLARQVETHGHQAIARVGPARDGLERPLPAAVELEPPRLAAEPDAQVRERGRVGDAVDVRRSPPRRRGSDARAGGRPPPCGPRAPSARTARARPSSSRQGRRSPRAAGP